MASGSFNIQASNTSAGVIQQGGNIHIGGNMIVQGAAQAFTELHEFSLPRLIETFRGRDEELKELESLFFAQNAKIVVISGLAGMGKSELAKQFANKCKKNGMVHHVFWVNAESLVSENKENIEKIRKLLKDIYQNFNKYKCIFVFDNTVNRKSVFELEPPNTNINYLLLITSQVKDWQSDVKSLRLNYLKSDSAIEVFRVILNELYSEQDCTLYLEIAEIVNNIPLGLQVTAAYVLQCKKRMGQHFVLQEYVDEITRNEDSYIDLKIPTNIANPYEKSLYGAIKVSINKLKVEENLQLCEVALNALFVSAFLNPEGITLDHLFKIPNIKHLLTSHKKNKNTLREALSLIDNYFFINFDPNYPEIKIHRFVQEILRHHLRKCDPDMQSTCYTACLEALFNEIQSDFNFYFCHKVVFKYADNNTVTFCKFYQKHKNDLFSNRDDEILIDILRSFIEWNCIESLIKLLDDILDTFHVMNCTHQCRRACGWTYILNSELLHHAALHNNVEVMKLLLQKYNYDVNSKNEFLETPLHTATENWNFEAIKILVEHNADVYARDCDGETPLFVFLEWAPRGKYIISNDVKEILGLLNFEEQTHTENEEGETLLHRLAYSNNVSFMKLLLLKYNFDINCTSKDQKTPLHTAAWCWHFEAIKVLLKHNADKILTNDNGETPLFRFIAGAYGKQHFKLCEVNEMLRLLGCKEYENTTNRFGDTLLHAAAESYNADMVILLTKHYNLDVNAQNTRHRFTPLHAVVEKALTFKIPDDVIRIVEALRSCGARLSSTDGQGRTPRQLAQEDEVTRYLVPFLIDFESA